MCFVADPKEIAIRMEACAHLLKKLASQPSIDTDTQEWRDLVRDIEYLTLELDGVTIEQRSLTEDGLCVKIICDQDALVHSFM